MTGDFRPFRDWAERSLDNGYIPVPMKGKRPAFKNWNNRPLGVTAIRNFAAKHPEYNLGFRTGCLVGIDIDIDEEITACRMQSVVEGMLGYTPYVRIGKFPRRTLFYRARKPVRSASFGTVDILGAGKLCVVAGTHPDTGEPYYWPEDSLLDHDFDDVPEINPNELDLFISWLKLSQDAKARATRKRAAEVAEKTFQQARAKRTADTNRTGIVQRNNTLFRRLLSAARKTNSKTELKAFAKKFNLSFRISLDENEVATIIDGIWKYKTQGRIFAPGRQSIVLPIGKNEILSISRCPEALYLVMLLKATRTEKTFTIPQKATAKQLDWGSNRVKKAIEALINAGWLRRIGNTPVRHQARYEWMGIFTV